MKNKYAQAQHNAAVAMYRDGVSVTDIVTQCGIPRSTLYSWIKSEKDYEQAKKPSVKQLLDLKRHSSRLEGMIQIERESGCNVNTPLRERLAAAEQLYGRYSTRMLCEALGIARGTFYNHMFRNKRDNAYYAKRREELRAAIQRIFDASSQIFGAEKIVAVLKSEGISTSKETVRELMRDMGLISIREGAKARYQDDIRKQKNYLNQQFDVSAPNTVWVSDVTQYNYNDMPYYICAVIDLFSRKVIAYKVGKRNSTQLVKSTFASAYINRKPGTGLIFHTDRGTNYRSYTLQQYLTSLSVTHSFSRAHVPYDNSVMEAFFKSLKAEELYRRKYRSEKELRRAIDDYIEFYNTRRPHKKNHYLTPEQKEEQYAKPNAELDIQSTSSQNHCNQAPFLEGCQK